MGCRQLTARYMSALYRRISSLPILSTPGQQQARSDMPHCYIPTTLSLNHTPMRILVMGTRSCRHLRSDLMFLFRAQPQLVSIVWCTSKLDGYVRFPTQGRSVLSTGRVISC
eukprot:Blabericola_migrator_1__6285@NODE_3170_length_1983_cov_9_465031_g1985_i0_p1_GENE_NODE_3170_length_1983_cov_9_465031_g1985_i0NODE_3170_length_1983_cov_9_465031_g1985_i0_p1_ORF_typecomplete_len112_score0_90_NODE_3170_length_1983_cov_9_465031_g1985_i085420